MQLAREEFVLEANEAVSLRVDMAAVDPLSTAGEVELTMRSWGLLVGLTGTLTVTVVQTPVPSNDQPRYPRERTFQLAVRTLTGKMTTLDGLESTSYISDVANKILDKEGIPVCQQRFVFSGQQLDFRKTLAYYNIPQGGFIWLILRLTGGKPVIYLQSPKALIATVSLSLSCDWSFSAIYPIAPVVSKYGQEHTEWTVDIKDYGAILHDIRTATDVSYLYWEA